MGLTTGLIGKRKIQVLKAHRLALYQSAYIKFLFDEVPLEYLNERLNKLIEIGITPKKVRGECTIKRRKNMVMRLSIRQIVERL